MYNKHLKWRQVIATTLLSVMMAPMFTSLYVWAEPGLRPGDKTPEENATTTVEGDIEINAKAGFIEVNVGVDVLTEVLVPQNANTVVLDLAKFNLKGLPYEMQPMIDHIKKMPEYKYGDIIDFNPVPYTPKGRPYLNFEESLINTGIVRHPNDITFSVVNNELVGERDSRLKMNPITKINKSYFLSTLGKVPELRDFILLSTRSKRANIANTDGKGVLMRGRQLIDDSPYQKEVNGQVDMGRSIVLVDYDDSDYTTIKMDNIHKPYISYLVDIGVVESSEIKDGFLSEVRGSKINGGNDLIRNNYSTIRTSVPKSNTYSNKDWNWESQITAIKGTTTGTLLPEYYINNEYKREETAVDGHNAMSYRAIEPNWLEDEDITVMEALEYIYKYVWFHEKEETLNQIEVDTVMSLYGIKFSNYTDEEIKVIKYLIAKGIVDPDQDDLELLRQPVLYKDLLKYMFRLKFPEKRFNFKNLTLTGDDVRLAKLGYVQDRFKVTQSSDKDLKEQKNITINNLVNAEGTLGYDQIFLEIPMEHYSNSNYTLSSIRDHDAIFKITPMEVEGRTYGMAYIPKSFSKGLVLRSTALEGGYRLNLTEWEDGGVYVVDSVTREFKRAGTVPTESNVATNPRKGEWDVASTSVGQIISNNKFLATDVILQVDSNKHVMYKSTPLFEGEQGARILNPALSGIFELIGNDRLKIKDVSTFAEIIPILADIQAPLSVSSDEATFMGYSQLSANGLKVSMIRDLDMNKLGIEILEDNVLYNRKLDLYGYLDLRTHTLYYGNTIVRYEPGTVMVEGVPGQESTFYNLDIVKTMLSKAGSNGSIANEIIEVLPPDEMITMTNQQGELYDTFYMHPNDASNRSGDWWINIATMGKKNSNVVYYKDKDISMLINYRTRVLKPDANRKNNNSFNKLIDSLKLGSLDLHPATNPLLQSALGYNGGFTTRDYNYGITLLYPSTIEAIEADAIAGGSSLYAKQEKENAFHALLNMFRTESEKQVFMGSVNSIAGFQGITMPGTVTQAVSDGNIGDTDLSRAVTTTTAPRTTSTDYYNSAVDSLPLHLQDIKGTVYLSSQEALREGGLGGDGLGLPAKFLNNNLYIRFKNFETFKQARAEKRYRFLDGLIYLYKLDPVNKSLSIVHEKVNYDNTPEGYIPLEGWDATIPVGEWKVKDKIVLRLGYENPTTNTLTPFMFDRVTPTKHVEGKGLIKISVTQELNNNQSLKAVYDALKNELPSYGEAVSGSVLETFFLTDEVSMRKFLSKSVDGSRNSEDTRGSLSGRWNATWDWVKGSVPLTEELLASPDFKLKSGVTYRLRPMYLHPAGTTLVNAGEDYYTGLKPTNEYSLSTSINPKPRVVLGNSFDIVNQNVAQLMTDTPVNDIPLGSLLILPSGMELISLGNKEFIITKGKPVGEGMESEEILMWRYLEDLNVRVGASLNFLNGTEGIRLPTQDEITGKSVAKFTELTTEWFGLKKSKIAYVESSMLKTGKLNKKELKEDTTPSADALMFPILKLDGKMTSTKLMQDKDKNGVYIIKDVGMSVDLGFVDYLRAGIVDVNSPFLEDNIDLEGIETSGSLIEAFRMKNLLIQISRILTTIRLAAPMLLFLYGISAMVFLILFAVPLTRNFMDNLIPEDVTIWLFKVMTLFSVDEMMDMNVPLGMAKAFLVMTISIVWWVLQR